MTNTNFPTFFWSQYSLHHLCNKSSIKEFKNYTAFRSDNFLTNFKRKHSCYCMYFFPKKILCKKTLRNRRTFWTLVLYYSPKHRARKKIWISCMFDIFKKIIFKCHFFRKKKLWSKTWQLPTFQHFFGSNTLSVTLAICHV